MAHIKVSISVFCDVRLMQLDNQNETLREWIPSVHRFHFGNIVVCFNLSSEIINVFQCFSNSKYKNICAVVLWNVLNEFIFENGFYQSGFQINQIGLIDHKLHMNIVPFIYV